MAADDTPGNLTTGVELEFLLICPMEDANKIATELDIDLDMAPSVMIQRALLQPRSTACSVPGCNERHPRHLALNPLEDFDSQVRPLPSYQYRYTGRPASEPLEADPSSREVYSGWTVGHDESLDLRDDEEAQYQSFVDADENGLYICHQAEISSRILNVDKPTPNPNPDTRHPHDIAYDWRFEIQYVLDTLHLTFNNHNRPGYRCFVNASCGGHVHVGGHDKSQSLHIARGVMCMYTAFERLIDEALTVGRISGHDARDFYFEMPNGVSEGRTYNYPRFQSNKLNGRFGAYCKPFSSALMKKTRWTYKSIERAIAANPQATPAPLTEFQVATTRNHVPAWLYRIMDSQNLAELHDVGGGDHFCAVNFENLSDDHDDPKRLHDTKWTIEFRAGAGSINAQEVIAWVETCTQIFRVCRGTSSLEISGHIIDRWADPDYTFHDLLQDIQVSRETLAFYRRMTGLDDYAHGRARTILRHEDRYVKEPHDLKSIMRLVVQNEYDEKRQFHVREKVRHKFELGLYGKFPKSFVDAKLPADIRHLGHKLTMTRSDGPNGDDNANTNDPVSQYKTYILADVSRSINEASNRNGKTPYRDRHVPWIEIEEEDEDSDEEDDEENPDEDMSDAERNDNENDDNDETGNNDEQMDETDQADDSDEDEQTSEPEQIDDSQEGYQMSHDAPSDGSQSDEYISARE